MVDYVADFTLEEQPEIEADFSIEVPNTDHNTLLNRDLPNQHPIGAITGLDLALSGKQDVLTAGEGISIDDGVISATVQSAVWGNITGTLSDQTDLQNALDGKLDSSALDGYATEYWVENKGYITGITSSDVTTALGYTPYSDANPAGYTSNIGTVTSVNNVSPVDGNVTLSIPAAQVNSDWNAVSGVAEILNKPTIPTVNNATITFTQGGTTKGTITLNQSSNQTIAFDAGGGGGTVDQTYNSTSSNAQSGIAIAGAGFLTSSALSGYATEAWVGNQGYQLASNIATTLTSTLTDSQYPSAKLFYDTCGDIESAINTIRGV